MCSSDLIKYAPFFIVSPAPFKQQSNNMAPKAAKPSKRSTGFSQVEIDNMLESIEKILPVAGMEWDRVERQHEGRWPDKRRTKESLKRKFQSLYRRRVPTGNPNCPPDVRFAKRCR